ncbi:MAG: dTDP-4-dehydrorhamnose 3,5-epimerase [bacterium]
MKFLPLEIPGAFLVELERRQDSRGFFARSWCRDEFKNHGLNPNLVQCNVSYNESKGTLRGMHFHKSLSKEAKLVRCTRGAIFDVIVDLRRESPSFRSWRGFELNESNHLSLYVPEGCAHGFLTLEDRTEVFYQMSDPYEPNMGSGIAWDDPEIGIEWPIPGPYLLSEKDATWPKFEDFFPNE